MQSNEHKLESYRLLTAKEVGEYLNLSELTVTKYRKKGWIRAKKIGRQFLYMEKDVIKFILKVK